MIATVATAPKTIFKALKAINHKLRKNRKDQ
jgi:hypothetical protein